MSNEIIFHHYPSSPFSEKVRVAFGIKGLSWRAVEQPIIMPKPDLVPLTGGAVAYLLLRREFGPMRTVHGAGDEPRDGTPAPATISTTVR